ncbi:AAA family ATPase [Gellertiella hungarica]|uniref:RecA-family ATPase n=1 Tax=Gellertiella hungarica TaxID=1572859 RepID=A0A7W6J9R6_9HYPH|nr:AAA family ATPase [Gellertiella hungarica]MBB4067421.1 RecA-family ATPase [Gellertiella hungarica]
MAALPKITKSAPGEPFQKLESANDNKAPISAEALLGMEFPPVSYVVDGYIAEGLTILAGRPKLGKSWMALGFAVAVATGGQALGVDCEPGEVLYLALEDNRRRLKERLEVVLYPPASRPDMSRLSLVTEAAKIGGGLVEFLDEWRKAAEQPKLVIIDTLSMVRPPKKSNQDSYAADYDAISPLQKWAGEHGVAVVVVHHVRKAEAEDPLEAVSGTNGLTGAADTIMVLNRNTDGPKLYGRGRDIEEIEKALRFDKGRWEVLGDADEVKRSDQRRSVLRVLEEAERALSPDDISKEIGMKVNNVNQQLRALIKSGDAEKAGYGQYKVAGR